MRKTLFAGLLPRVLAAMVAGILCSLFVPSWAVRIFLTFNSIFGNFLGFFIPLLIVGLIAPGIAEIGSGAGRLLAVTAALAYVSTILAGLFSYSLCRLTYPYLLDRAMESLDGADASGALAPYFTVEMEPMMTVTSALVLAFILGLGVASTRSVLFKGVLSDFRKVVNDVISKVIVPLLPIFIFGIFLNIGVAGNVGQVLGTFVKIIAVILVMHVTFLILQFCVAGAVAHKNPFKALVTMLPAYVTALGTQSSAATIPVTLEQAKKLGVKSEIADFTIPLCATIHLSCSMLKIVACAFAISFSMGLDISLGTYVGFMLMLGITMVAAPGVPGGAIMAALGVLEGFLGFDDGLQGLMIVLYIAMDSFGTAGNVTGDGAITLIVDSIKSKLK